MVPVLVVDDERMTRVGLRKVIEDSDTDLYVVGEAADGRSALEAARRLHPSIIICDVRMPHTDGVEFVRMLREETVDIAIVFVSGYSDKDYLQSAIRLSAVDYLEKPLDPQRVLEVLLRAADQYRRSQASRAAMAEQLARRVIAGRGSNDVDLGVMAEEAGFLQGRSVRYCVAALRPHGWWRADADATGDRSSGAWDPKVGQQLHERGVQSVSVPDGDASFLILACDSDLVDCAGVASFLASPPEDAAYCAISGWVPTLEGLYSAVDDAASACRSLYYSRTATPDASMVSARSDIGSELIDLPGFLRERSDDVARSLDRLDFDGAQRLLLDTAATLREARPRQIPLVSSWLTRIDAAVVEAMSAHLLPGSPYDQGSPSSAPDFEDAVARIVSRIREAQESTDGYQSSHHIVSARKYVRDHLDEPFGLRDVAEHCGLSSAHLSRLFSASCRKSFGRYVAGERMARAKLLLLQTSLQVAEVARSVGYPDQDYFSKVFRKLEGTSPSEYRKNLGRSSRDSS